MYKKNKNGFLDIKINRLIDWNEPNGEGCIASDRITKDGCKVGYMVRGLPMDDQPDSGWRFMAGDEDDEYMNNVDKHHVFAINTICNYDEDIIPFLNAEIGSEFIRIDDSNFEIDDRSKPIFMAMQKDRTLEGN